MLCNDAEKPLGRQTLQIDQVHRAVKLHFAFSLMSSFHFVAVPVGGIRCTFVLEVASTKLTCQDFIASIHLGISQRSKRLRIVQSFDDISNLLPLSIGNYY